jgi:hypothetical protein
MSTVSALSGEIVEDGGERTALLLLTQAGGCTVQQRDRRLPQGPAPAAEPGFVVQADGTSEHVPSSVVQPRECDHQVAGWISHAGASEVEDSVQPPVAYQDIVGGEVTVELDRFPLPSRGHRRVKHFFGQGCRDPLARTA